MPLARWIVTPPKERLAMTGLLLLAACALAVATFPHAACAETLHVTIKNMTFSNVPATAHVGDVVEWSNEDFVAHTATARDHGFDSLIAPGKTSLTVLRHPGRVSFFCRFHPTMTGEIDVAPAVTSAAGDRNNH